MRASDEKLRDELRHLNLKKLDMALERLLSAPRKAGQ
jgi:hypothetical protein